MRRFFAIPLLISLYIVCSSKSCSREDAIAGDEAAKVKTAVDSIRNEAEIESLSEQALFSYTKTAQLKFQDFADYLEILNDTSTNIEFREKAARMASSLFITDKINISNPFNASKNPLAIDELLSAAMSNSYPKQSFRIESISEEQAFRRVNDSLYSGRLSFNISSLNADSRKPGNIMGSIEIHVARISKNFGDRQIRTWKVYLGEMK